MLVPTRIRRAWVDSARVVAAAAALAIPMMLVLGFDPTAAPPSSPPQPPSALIPAAEGAASPSFASESGHTSARPVPSESEATAPNTGARSPLATTWRRAIISGQRGNVLQAAAALRRSPRGKEELVALARDPHPKVRAFALRELGRRDDRELAVVFQGALDDPSPYVQQNAAWALERLGPQ